MLFTVYITKCTNTIGIVGEKKYKNLEELKSKLKATGESYDKIKGFLRYKTLNLNDKAFTEEVTLRKEFQFTIANALGDFLNCENILDVPLSHYFENTGMSELEIEFINGWFQGAKNRALEYLEDYYPKDSSLDILKRYESAASVEYSERYVQNERGKDGGIWVCDFLSDVYTENFSIKYSSQRENNFFMIPFAIIHYLNSHEYRIKKCNHCHKYFSVNSVKSRRKIYCDRNSPYKGFDHLNCEQAVRDILVKLKRKRLSIYKKLYEIDPMWKTRDFSFECNEYTYDIKKESSVENLQKYEQFLKNYKIKGT